MPASIEQLKEYSNIIDSQVLVDVMKYNAVIESDWDGSLPSEDI